ncbi:antibiotic biosynthesis monooxygenase [Rhodococcus hoagii]|jgi:quinol monooxygenase YgiN|uniref:Antibiotic biosynthesis monooxygenase n=2 Tax=Rhodococcus hoagii TaxID=43767 RepID=E9T0Y8_RHOHA|nr:putative quinol monooxygenase [Prescottella equi]MBU4613310.1 antibiotic biosynthesis monooxygenase [Rhodococcus sp. GG48]GBF14503.1 putative monooxygenase YcnE [Rhodococcus sp. Br-6]AVP67212.1 antibiotic biosynthesis monooxygenase [Prescottella equi]EGD24089.1 antibiotic biosynthesis monooxygenase [Prescottella equi ATCC 33707]ERN47075.1 antibiotic biosynthesis monooxygenase [Prescottella equi NBRC 101255 = C 7]
MIFIVVKFKVLPEHQENWLSITKDFTDATRSETGNLWYEWSRSVDDPSEYVLVEAFRDAEAGAEHVAADHFRRGLESMRPALSETPRIINTEVPGTEWSRMGELEIAQ